jgi:hypothetical protein
MTEGPEDAAAGMDVIRRVFTTLYATDSVDASSASDLIESIPQIMDEVLRDSLCPFKTHRESLTAFAGAVYALRVENGRCVEPGTPDGCRFYDPHQLYQVPPIDTITYSGGKISLSAVDQRAPAGVKSSFGLDLVDVILEPAVDRKTLTLDFHGAAGAAATFNVQLWQMGPGARQPRPITAEPETTSANTDGKYSYTIANVNTAAVNRLALIITRLDPHESTDPVGAYTITLESR